MAKLIEATAARTRSIQVSSSAYRKFAWAGLVGFSLIVMTGAAVRLTDSGLGCPEWPKCYGKVYPPLSIHAVIEYANRTITVPLTIVAILVWLAALRRRPYRRDLTRWSFLLPLGVVAQAILGGLTVLGHLAYGWVMAHFCLSMLILVAAWEVVWRSRQDGPPTRPADLDRRLLWGARAVVFLGALTIFAGTAATAAGPHSGGGKGEKISRMNFDGVHTLEFVVHRHAEVAIAFGLAAVGFWLLCRHLKVDRGLMRAATTLCLLIAVQGAVGGIQYETHLPAALVWVHVCLATITWVATLWVRSATVAPEGQAVEQPAAYRLEALRQPVSP